MLLPEKQVNETPLGQHTPETDRSTPHALLLWWKIDVLGDAMSIFSLSMLLHTTLLMHLHGMQSILSVNAMEMAMAMKMMHVETGKGLPRERGTDAQQERSCVRRFGELHLLEECAGKPMKPVLVVMVGGCTFAEMTALKTAMMKRHNVKPIILTTDIITGDRLISSFIPASTKLAMADAQATMATL
jgi:hypothetical protein